MKRPPKSSFPKQLHLYRVELPTYTFWAEDEFHAKEQFLDALGLKAGALSLDMVDFIVEEVD